ncbi:hypothetical protein HQO38_18805 [Rhodococcus fascians]|nr:hypothetical protein [Rhodococcus fascians]MBY4140519.1 hypothetical protein [Rhodococcus fascians]MBY4219013.1 hypothetical protein [Rhodococcus fascians]MBY4221965.1 hypothetical protein [Rhodococcus fascians]MBY4233966.1 hypothetical protein [Rhodococcus fascians]
MPKTETGPETSPGDEAGALDDSFHEENVHNTYRNLRMGMVVLVAVLAASILFQARSSGWCFETSISAYYYTNSHVIFVSVLCALGTLLVVYKGNSDTEDSLYDFAGFWAFLVAMVPTGWPTKKSAGTESCRRGLCGGEGLPVEFIPEQAVGNNVSSVLAGVAVVAILVVLNSLLKRRAGRRRTWTALGTVARVFGVGISAFLILKAFRPSAWVDVSAHSLSAIFMFVFIILAVLINACFAYKGERAKKSTDEKSRIKFGLVYLIFAVGMLGSLISAAYYHFKLEWTLSVLITEASLLFFFAGFWISQTVELWGKDGSRRDVVVSKF